jgi:signal transduction histidine kinase
MAGYLEDVLRKARGTRLSLVVKIALPTLLLALFLSFVSAQVLGFLFARTHEIHAQRRANRFSTVVEDVFRQEMQNRHTDLGPFLKLLCRAGSKSAFVTDQHRRVRFSCSDELLGAVVDVSADDGQRVTHGGATWVRRIRPIVGDRSCEECHGAANPVGYFAVDLPVEEADAEIREQLKVNLIAGGILGVILAAILILVQVLLVFRPMKLLTSTVERIRGGDLGARASVSRRDEIGQLAQSLNDMAASIEQANAELDRAHRAELAQSDKLAGLGQLISTIAHEIKNPLAGIIGALKVVEADAPAADPNKAILGKILAQMERLSKTVVAALDLARPLKPAVTQVDLVDLLERTLFFVERQASEQQVELRKRYEPRLARVRIDPDLMRQVFLNIFLNGIQAMPRGGALDVEVRTAGHGSVEAIISDQGVGIPPEHLERVFSPFFSTKPRGTGLGLYVARQIVEMQQGHIRVTSRQGQGTSFTVRLPAEEASSHVAR